MEGGYEGAEAFGRRTFGNLGERRKHLEIRDYMCFLVLYFLVGSLDGLLQGCTRLLGVLGSGARIPKKW
jgi:hypothetical protein